MLLTRQRLKDPGVRSGLSDELKAAYLTGTSIRTLANVHGLSFGTVRTLLLEAGVALRGRGGRNHVRKVAANSAANPGTDRTEMTAGSPPTGTWTIDQSCALHCSVEDSDLANLDVGEEDHRVKLRLTADGMRRLAAVSSMAVGAMDALSKQENSTSEAEATVTDADQNGASS